ncbi:hypothetical protein [Spirosoma rhododendri]|uniref:Uncharacterized protein n=1 Tax=Spirosoma rhododendri TaxID=2728024 RepID=A0A7L5DYI3_9BACT|nr:hypothetical protein [Spirosoma rhododendri]QJD81037.1 hypothetical protein HH216_23385 [Spirosoma rhododendri]
MKNQITDKIDALKSEAVSQEAFMNQLAQLDEQGQANPELLDQVNGGIAANQLPFPVLGLWLDPDTIKF